MAAPTFRRATRTQARLRLALAGPAGSGKTYSALKIAAGVAGDKPIALIDTERGSASKYAGIFPEFDVLELETFHPQNYIDAIQAASDGGYGVLVIDSLSHAWMGKGGTLELVDNAAKRSQSKNSFDAWREVTPVQNALVDAILRANLHIIATLRSKQDYILEPNANGKMAPRKVGLAPVQRDGLEYEFDVYGDLDADNTLIIGKTRCPELAGAVIPKPGEALAKTLLDWLGQGEPEPEIPPAILALFDQHKEAISKAGPTATELRAAYDAAEVDRERMGATLWDRIRAAANDRRDALPKKPVAAP